MEHYIEVQPKLIRDSNPDWLSVGSVRKCCACITLLQSVILPSMVQIGH